MNSKHIYIKDISLALNNNSKINTWSVKEKMVVTVVGVMPSCERRPSWAIVVESSGNDLRGHVTKEA